MRESRSLEGGRRYTTGGCTELGCDDPPGTFGVTETDGKVRVVWHYPASDEVRTFEIRYALRGIAVAYDDVVDVNLQVWGDEWPAPLGRLTATPSRPGTSWRVGHPVWVKGDVEPAGSRRPLRALDVPAHQFVELRALFPRAAFSSTAGMRTARGQRAAKITADEREDAAAYERDHDQIDHAKRHPWLLPAYVLLLGLVPALLVVAAVFWLFGRELPTGYDREYEQEPPTDTQPALVPTLLRQGGEAGSFEFTATLFDLIRRGVYTAKPVTTERSIWAGLRTEPVADLELSAGDRTRR